MAKRKPPPKNSLALKTPKGVFDVPLNLPPVPSHVAKRTKDAKKAGAPGRLYVCPICGDNALTSLRERDEHLQNEHDGELVFPCQVGTLKSHLKLSPTKS